MKSHCSFELPKFIPLIRHALLISTDPGFTPLTLNPRILGDAGYQLSFGATLGLVLYAEPLAAWFERLITHPLSPSTWMCHPLSPDPLPPRRFSLVASRLVSEYFLFTLAAQAITLPIMAIHFRRLSLVSLVANPAILPALPAVMVLGGLAVLLGMVFLPLGQVVGALAWPFAAYTIRMVELIARLPGGARRSVLWVGWGSCSTTPCS